MEKKKVAPHALISGILFVLMAIVLVVDLIGYRDNSVFTHSCSLLSTAGYVITAIALFMANRARPKLLVIGFIIQAAVVVFVLIDHLVIYGAADIRAAFILSRLFKLAAWVGAIMISVACLAERLPQDRASVKKVWFVPAACYAVGVIIWSSWAAAHLWRMVSDLDLPHDRVSQPCGGRAAAQSYESIAAVHLCPVLHGLVGLSKRTEDR